MSEKSKDFKDSIIEENRKMALLDEFQKAVLHLNPEAIVIGVESFHYAFHQKQGN